MGPSHSPCTPERHQRNRLELIQAESRRLELALLQLEAVTAQATDDAEVAQGRCRLVRQELEEVGTENRRLRRSVNRHRHNWRLRVLQAGNVLFFGVPAVPMLLGSWTFGITWLGLALFVGGGGCVAVGCVLASTETI